MRRSLRALLAALALLVAIVPAALAAGAPTGSGFVWLTSPPANIAVNTPASEDDQNMRVFAERTNFVLPSAVDVNFTAPGTYDEASDLPTAFPIFPKIPAGTIVNSYYIHVDQTDAKGDVPFTATITFPDPIIGVILTDGRLDASRTVLGVPGTTYPTLAAGGAFGYELKGPCPASGQDCATLSADRRTLALYTRSTTWPTTCACSPRGRSTPSARSTTRTRRISWAAPCRSSCNCATPAGPTSRQPPSW